MGKRFSVNYHFVDTVYIIPLTKCSGSLDQLQIGVEINRITPSIFQSIFDTRRYYNYK